MTTSKKCFVCGGWVSKHPEMHCCRGDKALPKGLVADRRKWAWELRQRGYLFKDIAEQLGGITTERARTIVLEHESSLRRQKRLTSEKMVETKFEITERTLLRLGDDILDKIGDSYAYALKRKRDELLCARDGHVTEGRRYEIAGICDRCTTIVDRERYEATKAG